MNLGQRRHTQKTEIIKGKNDKCSYQKKLMFSEQKASLTKLRNKKQHEIRYCQDVL